VSNGGYGEIRKEMLAMGAMPTGTDFPSPDFPLVARGLGCHGIRALPSDVGAAVEDAFAKDRPTVIEVPAG
jgi:acetolactate synthase-1/2/3 large subunit